MTTIVSSDGEPHIQPMSRFQLASVYGRFLVSGVAALIYQVVWVRQFGNLFGNTVYSAAWVTSAFMRGLGVGSYVIGKWADRWHQRDPVRLLRAYGVVQLIIGITCVENGRAVIRAIRVKPFGKTTEEIP